MLHYKDLKNLVDTFELKSVSLAITVLVFSIQAKT